MTEKEKAALAVKEAFKNLCKVVGEAQKLKLNVRGYTYSWSCYTPQLGHATDFISITEQVTY